MAVLEYLTVFHLNHSLTVSGYFILVGYDDKRVPLTVKLIE